MPDIQPRKAPAGGHGAPIVALHGFLGQTAMWSPVFADAAGLGPVALGRLPGHGLDPWNARATGFAEAVDEMAAALPPEPAWLVGYSMGARLALALVLDRPERFLGAVLNGVHPGLRDERERAARAAWDDQQAEAIERGGLDAFVEAWEALPLFATQARLPLDVQSRQRAARRAHEARSVAGSMRLLGLGRMPPRWGDLARCTRPLVLVTGVHDEKFGALADAICEIAPRARHTRVPGVGHNVALEAPDALRAIVRDSAGVHG